MTGRMGDADGQPRIQKNVLRRDTTSPIDGNLARFDVNSIAPIRTRQIRDTNLRWITIRNRRAMRLRKPTTDCLGLSDLIFRDRAHGYNRLATKPARRHEVDVGPIHRDVLAGLDMTDRNTILQKRILKGERTPQRNSH